MRRLARWLLAVVALLALFVLGVAGWQYRLRLERDELLAQEEQRAPVAWPKSPAAVATPLPAPAPKCITGVVLANGAPAANVQVNVSGPSKQKPALCPCGGDSVSCACPAGLEWMLGLKNGFGAIDAVQSATSQPNGQFAVCGLDTADQRYVWAEAADGRLGFADTYGLVAVAPGEAPVTLTLRDAETLVGRVQDEAGAPVAGANLVVFTVPPVRSVRATSGNDGVFSLAGPAGAFTVVAGAPGYATSQRSSRASSEPLILTLTRPATLAVRVLSRGAPVDKATVSLGKEQLSLTDRDGWARFTGLSRERSLTIDAQKDRLVGSLRVQLREGDETRVSMSLEPGSMISGRLTRRDGLPLARADVHAQGEKFATLDVAPDGTFRSKPLPLGRYTLYAGAADCADTVKHELVLGEADSKVDLALGCEATLSGSVTNARGEPLSEVEVSVACGDEQHVMMSEATGAFRFATRSGSCQLKAKKRGYKPLASLVEAPTRDVKLVLDAGATLSGRVVDAKGAPLREVTVAVFPALFEDLMRARDRDHTIDESDAKGEFSIGGLLPGRVVAIAVTSKGTAKQSLLLMPGEQRTGVELVVQATAMVTGVVMDEQRRPVPGARASVSLVDEKSAVTAALGALAGGDISPVLDALPSDMVTGLDGTFAVRAVAGQKWKLNVSANGFEHFEREVKDGERVEAVLTRDSEPRVSGRVVDERGVPVTSFFVDSESFFADDGRFVVRARLRLTISAPGYAPTEVKAKVPKEGTLDLGDVTLTRGVELRVAVIDDSGAAVAGARVSAGQKTCTTGADGRCRISDLGAGKVTVVASSDGFVSGTKKDVEASAGDVEVVVRKAKGSIEGHAIAGATVTLVPGWKSMLCDASGTFHFAELVPGTYRVWVDRERSGEAVKVEVGDSPVQVLLGAGSASVDGVVRSRGAPLTGTVVAVLGSPEPLNGEDLLDPDDDVVKAGSRAVWAPVSGGQFSLGGLSAGRWQLYAAGAMDLVREDVMPVTSIEVSGSDHQRVDLELKP